MCTVSWLPDAAGYTLCFNRDERSTRRPALPLARREAGGMPYLAPADGDFGGTWLAVNAEGLTLGIVNRYRGPEYVPPSAPRSRGLVPLDLVACATASEAIAGLERLDLARLPPFTLVAASPGGPVHLAAWDGRDLALSFRPEPGLVATSSSVTEPEVAEARTALFAAAVPVTVERLRDLHRSHLPDRGKRSVCMHRDDAETQSYSEVCVTEREIRFSHIADAPCRGTIPSALTLPRRASS